MTAKALGFDRPMANSLDAVSDRDFVLETLSAASITAVHLSRFAEEIVIWTLAAHRPDVGSPTSSPPARRSCRRSAIRTPPNWCAPRPAASSARCQALLIVMKGLPLAYQKDMQEDKEGAIDALSALSLSIAAMTGMVRDMTPDVARMRRRPGEGYSTATDLADWLVRTLNMPFREAHHVTGRIVAKAAADGVPLHRLPLAAMQSVEPRITEDVFAVLSVDHSVQQPGQPWRDGAEERAPGGQPLAQGADERAAGLIGSSEPRHRIAARPRRR